VAKIPLAKNLVDLFTKTLLQKIFESHLEGMRVKCMPNWNLVQVGVCWGLCRKSQSTVDI
jgi:hypothetical protein